MTISEAEPATAPLDPPEAMQPLVELVDSVASAAPVLVSASVQEPDVGRNATIGAAIGFVVSLVTVTVAGVLGGLGFNASIGLGAFVGFWGGIGFGFMMGATIPIARHLAAHPDHPTHR